MTNAPDYAQDHLDRGTDRIGLHIYPEPDCSPNAPVVVIWPAMGVPAGYYTRFATALRKAGLAVVVAELRGTGTSTPHPSRASRYGYAELVSDVAAVQESLKPRLDGRRRILLGHSLGGQLTLLHTALAENPMVDGLVLVATGLPYWRSYPGSLRRHGLRCFTSVLSTVTETLGVWPGWGFGGRQPRGVIRDWAHIIRTGRFPVIDGVDPEPALRAVRVPVLAVDVEGDWHTPAHTLDLMCRPLSAAPLVRECYRTEEAGFPMDHFSWVRAGDRLAGRVARFAAEPPQ
ncbi:MAG TPA: alpha/beta fold hydrolase [Micromonosporaceae bacterium]